MKSVSHKKLES